MFCAACGDALDEKARFCPSCGAAVDPEVVAGEAVPRSADGPWEPGPSGQEPWDEELSDPVPSDLGPWNLPGTVGRAGGRPSAGLSRAHYLWALLGIVGGVIGWAVIGDRDRRLGRRVLVAGAIVSAVAGAVSIAVSLLVASAVTDLATTTPTFAATPAVTTGPTMPVDTVPAGALTKTWSFSGSAAGGYSMAGTLKVGAPEEVQTGLTIGNATLQTANGAGCAVDSTTDAVVPAELSVRNTSQDFDARVGITIDDDLGGHQLNAYTSDVQWEGQYTSGMACDSDTDETINLSSNDAIRSSSTVIVYGFIIFTNYYSPAYPKGNPAILNDAILGIDEAQAVASTSQDISYTITSVTGPGVTSETPAEWSFSLSGNPAPSSSTTTTTPPSTTTTPLTVPPT